MGREETEETASGTFLEITADVLLYPVLIRINNYKLADSELNCMEKITMKRMLYSVNCINKAQVFVL